MPEDESFSLGGSIWDFTRARGCAAPQQHAPHSWRASFASSDHTDGSALSGLFTSCRPGRDWVLENAPRCTLTLDATSAEQPTDAWLSPLQLLRLREQLPSSLVVIAIEAAEVQTRLQHLGEVLAAEARNIHKITICAPQHSRLNVACVPCRWLVLPSLRSLQLVQCWAVLPSPASVPSLTELTISSHFLPTELSAQVHNSIAALLPQLSAFTFTTTCHRPLFTPSVSLPTLTDLRLTGETLTDALLDRLIQSAPSLQHLSVRQVRLGSDQHSQSQWQVRELSAVGFEWPDLARLPGRAAGRTAVTCREIPPALRVTGEGIAADIADRFTIVTEHLIVAPSDNLPAAAQPHALRVALQQLATLQVAPVAAVQLSLQWQWPEALVAAAAAETAALSHLGCDMRLSAQALTDQLLGWLLEAGPLIKQVSVCRLALQSDTHANTPWPWEELTVATLDVTQLLKLPNLMFIEGGPVRVSGLSNAIIGSDLITADAECLRQRLQHIACVWRIKHVTLEGIACDQVNDQDTEQHYRAQVGVLQSLFPATTTHDRDNELVVELRQWSMTHAAMEVLRGLPQVPHAELRLTDCDWPLALSQYGRLVECLPLSYTKLRVPTSMMPVFEEAAASEGRIRCGQSLLVNDPYVRDVRVAFAMIRRGYPVVRQKEHGPLP